MPRIPDNTLPGTAADPAAFARQPLVWFALLGGGAAWAVHLLLAYGISEFGCVGGADARAWLNLSAVAWAVLAVSLLTFALALAATFSAYHVTRSARPLRAGTSSSGGRDAQGRATLRFAGGMALWLDGLFAFVIAFQTIPIFFYLGRC